MSNRSSSFNKRQREVQLKDRAKEKQQRRAAKKPRPEGAVGDEDPDIAGIVPGPQPIPTDEP